MINLNIGGKNLFKTKHYHDLTCTKLNNNLNSLHFILSFVIFSMLFQCNFVNSFSPNNDHSILDSCQKCRILVNSFTEGLKRTARGKHEGGDAHWEENKLSNYADSEIRLTEIQENLCAEVTKGKDQCHSFAEQYENEIEDWFFNNRKKERKEKKPEGSTLFEYLCNEISNACCPEGHFGSDCRPCFGYPENVCFNRGYCSGNGTRQGDGKCICYSGFDGETCEKCHISYLPVESTEIIIDGKVNAIPEQCLRCDLSCASSCHSIGPKGCNVCRAGYYWDNDTGCIDIDECNLMELNPCKYNTYCINTQGSFKCFPCHESCQGCTNKGSNSCIECASNYVMNEDGSNCIPKKPWQINIRYTLYFATVIIFTFFILQRKIILASIMSLLLMFIVENLANKFDL